MQENIDKSGLSISHEVTTPARGNLFDVDGESPLLEGKEFEIFQRDVAKLIYIAIRAHLDMLLPVAFLCTRVTKRKKQDQTKCKHSLEYVKGSIDSVYSKGAKSLNKIQSWVDTAYAVHPNMESHPGGVSSIGLGGFMGKSTNHN